MPDRKEPSRTPKPRQASRAKPSARRSAGDSAAPARRSRARRRPEEPEDLEQLDPIAEGEDDGEGEGEEEAAPVAVAGAPSPWGDWGKRGDDSEEPGTGLADAARARGDTAADAPVAFDPNAGAGEPGADSPLTGVEGVAEEAEEEQGRAELLVGVFLAALAASVFVPFPWYVYGASEGVSGWSSGTWGPITFFMALAGIAIIVLRRFRVRLQFPVEHSLVLEGIGWLTVVGVIAKRFLPLKRGAVTLGLGRGLWVTLVLGGLVAWTASRISKSAPVVLRPNWFAGRAGKIGAGLLVLALAAGVAAGMMVEPFPQDPLAGARNSTFEQLEREPACIKEKGFPVLEGADDVLGYQVANLCMAAYTTRLSLRRAYSRWTGLLRDRGWKFTPTESAQERDLRVIQLTGPQCGQMTFSRQAPVGGATARNRRGVTVQLQDSCSTIAPVPGGR